MLTSAALVCSALVLPALSPAFAQQAKDNWMHEYVQSRVATRTLKAIQADPTRTAPTAEMSVLFGPRIVGGVPANPADNPFQVGLLQSAQADNFRAQFCGGTLIRANFVVTAAHCSDFITANDVQVLTGTQKLDGSGDRRNVVRITIHPGWNPDTFDNDAAVWELSSAATGIALASLGTDDGTQGSNLLVTGWGTLAEGGARPTNLRKVTVPLASRTNCNDANSYNGEITDSMLCAGNEMGGMDSCQGDSGGPLTGGGGSSVLTGIVSWGTGCARPNLFGVYTRVSRATIRDFINATINQQSGALRLYQLHNDGEIWQSTGAPCSGDSCPGWQRLDNNPRSRALAATGNSLFQLHNDGAIWRFTGMPCAGSCQGWERLDNNPRTIAIGAAAGKLFQLHNNGEIWRSTGLPCSGNSCPGWERLDNNPRTIAIAAAAGNLFQLHNNGEIWRSTGAPCSGNSCLGWERLDSNPRSMTIAASAGLFQLHNNGDIWRSTGVPCSGNSCPGWERLDNNPRTMTIASAAGALFQLHNDGAIWRSTGAMCSGNSCAGWERLDNNPRGTAIAAAPGGLFQLHNNGDIWRSTGVPCSGNSCPGWERLDNNPRSVMIVAPAD